MRIGISTRGLYQGSFAVSTIINQLTQVIIDMASDDHEIYLYLNNPDYESIFVNSVHKRSIKINNRFIWDHVWLPRELRKDQIDIALFMKGTMPLRLSCRGAVIYHDLGYFDSELRPYKKFETIYMRSMMRRTSEKATVVFTDSVYTKQEVERIFHTNPKKIAVCYQDCGSHFKYIDDQKVLDSVRSKLNLPRKFMFFPTSVSPRKNLERVLDAFNRIMDIIPHHLVITGGQSWRSRHLLKRIDTEFDGKVHVLGNLVDGDMPALYSLANFTIYPSLLEGFGQPILEAFRCRCPVLTSNITAMPEIAGDAAYLVDPYDTEQISAGMLRLAKDRALQQDLIIKGVKRAKYFSWEKTAGIIIPRLESA